MESPAPGFFAGGRMQADETDPLGNKEIIGHTLT